MHFTNMTVTQFLLKNVVFSVNGSYTSIVKQNSIYLFRSNQQQYQNTILGI